MQRERIFGAAVSFLYFGNLIFRLGHNVIFAFLAPRNRVLVSFGGMICAMLTLIILLLSGSQWLGFVFFAYFFGGVGIGTFEANILNVCTCLGVGTKLWAVIGIPVGVVSMTIGGFVLIQLGVHILPIYSVVFVFLCIGVCCYLARMYKGGKGARAPTLAQFFGDLKKFREWLPQTRLHAFCMMVNMFTVSLLSPGIILYIYHSDPVKLKGIGVGTIPMATFIIMYNAAFFIGDFFSRKIVYRMRTFPPFLFLILNCIGAGFALSGVPLIVPLGGLFVSSGNGCLYAQSCRHFDRTVPKIFNLMSLSFWLFIGDIGAVLGSNMIPYIYEAIR